MSTSTSSSNIASMRAKIRDRGEEEISEVAADLGPVLRKHTGKVVVMSLALGLLLGLFLRPRLF